MPGVLQGMDMKPKDRQSPGKLSHPIARNEPASARPSARGAQRPAGSRVGVEQDAPPSNTASYNCNSQYFKPLQWGIDSLYLSYQGELFPEIETRLKALKQMAQASEVDQQALAQYPIEGHVFEVKDKGAPLFPYILEDGVYRIQLSRGYAVPMAYVKVSSGYLAHVGPVKAEQTLRRILDQFGTLQSTAQVSRIDLFVDFVSVENMESWTREAWVTRAKGINAYAVEGRFSGWSIGLGGAIAARLYDKVLEIKKSGKLYLLELWAQTGYREGDPVWRLEFQFKRTVLSQLGVVSLGSVLNQLNGLWGYAMTDWLRLTLPNPDDRTRSRWPVHPLWGYLSSIDWETNGGPLLRQYPLARVPGDDKLFSLYFSALISYMAREGINDLYQAQDAMTAAVVAYYTRIRRLLSAYRSNVSLMNGWRRSDVYSIRG
jgi:hypothetical protein